MSIFLSQKQAREFLNITRTTILRWEEQGKIKVYKTSGGHRRYLKSDLEKIIGMDAVESEIKSTSICVIYARVSTKKQEITGNLDRQVGRFTSFALDSRMSISHVIKEVASGINENRKGIKSLLSIIDKEPIQYLVIEYKDRLARFGYNYLEAYCRSHGVEIITIEQQEKKELNEEMVEEVLRK
ncbi:IS607 family transposase [Neobacillus sp. NPDC093182]|uniref:IS607 family transposase n=1 Tax=Neobacillus sp. NPDC093182 TaxID=3364297 RepID=UPI003822836E